MYKCLFVFVIMALFVFPAFAQDPGLPDSLKIDTVYVQIGTDTFVDDTVWVKNDEAVAFLYIPLEWSSSDNNITLDSITLFWPLTEWDEAFDTVYSNFKCLITGWADLFADPNPYLNTGYGWEPLCLLHFTITSEAEDQLCLVDTTRLLSPLAFGDTLGICEWAPAFVPGGIAYNYVGIDDEIELPTEFFLSQNSPNPFNTQTTIKFALPENSIVTLEIYNIIGQLVERPISSQSYPAGYHSFVWQAKVASGIYIYRIVTDQFSKAKKMILLK